MDKGILSRYCDMKARIRALKESIRKIEKEIAKLNEEIASDVVTGGLGGTQHFTVTGIPSGTIRKKEALLKRRRELLTEDEVQLLELTNEAEEYILSLEKEELRTMFEFYYIDGLTWAQTAIRMNSLYPNRKIPFTDESCRQQNKRFFDKM